MSFLSLSFCLLSLFLSSGERGEQKKIQVPKHVSGGPRARTCFTRDYKESPTCRGSVFTRPRNSGLDACLRHPSEAPWARRGRARRREGKRDKRAPLVFEYERYVTTGFPPPCRFAPEIPGFCREDRPDLSRTAGLTTLVS